MLRSQDILFTVDSTLEQSAIAREQTQSLTFVRICSNSMDLLLSLSLGLTVLEVESWDRETRWKTWD